MTLNKENQTILISRASLTGGRPKAAAIEAHALFRHGKREDGKSDTLS